MPGRTTPFDSRITIGPAPDGAEVSRLASAGCRTLIDLRDDQGEPERELKDLSLSLGLTYVSIPISCDGIELEDVVHFYLAAFERGSAPIYAFSRFGKRPLAFLLLLRSVVEDTSLAVVFEEASRAGYDLSEDQLLAEFLTQNHDRARMREVVEMLQHIRPDLLRTPPGQPQDRVE